MNLKLQLLLRIIGIATLCLAVVIGFVLWTAQQGARQRAESTAERLARQLTLQLMRISTGTDLAERFPDWGLLEPQRHMGLCIRYVDHAGPRERSSCFQPDPARQNWPLWFERIYRTWFGSAAAVERPVTWNGKLQGRLSVLPLTEQELADAWQRTGELSSLSLATVVAISLLIFGTLIRLLQPTERIVRGLDCLQRGDLSHRLPAFEVHEFDRIGKTVNRLAEHLQASLATRAELSQRLITAHEDERRWLAGELHDELGQYLAGIHALSAAICFTAARDCPQVLADAEQIGQSVAQMQALVQDLLVRLRPPELDELGLAECLARQVRQWQARSRDRTLFELRFDARLSGSPPQLTGQLYRIVQEGLNNAAKHACATRVLVTLLRERPEQLLLVIEDNGSACALIPEAAFGHGLRGIHERVMALGGTCELDLAQPSGLILRIRLPLGADPRGPQ